jgi:DUF4097 and DUF4098 domain-containing protein YvlB
LTSAFVKAQESGEFPVPLSDPAKRGKLKAHLNSGSITVIGTARKDILVKYSSGDGDKDKNKDGNEKGGLRKIGGSTLDLEVSETANSVIVNSDSWSYDLNLIIEVPSGFDVQAHTYNNGDLLIKNIQGVLELTNYNGEIVAENISGSVVANTFNGDVRATFSKVTENTPMSFSTYNGDVDLTMPPAFKGTMKLKTEQGEIYTDFDAKMVKTDPIQKKDTKSGVYKITINDWTTAEINGGGPEFTLKNYHGDIYIRKKIERGR